MAKVKAPALSPQDQQATAITAVATTGADLASADASGLVNVTGVSGGIVNLPAGKYSGQTIVASNITAATTFTYSGSNVVGDVAIAAAGVGMFVWYFSASGTGLWYSVGA